MKIHININIKTYIKLYIKTYINIYIIFLLTVCISCRELLFSDEERSRQIFPGNFSSVTVKGTFNIVLIQDSADMVVVSGTNNINAIEAESIQDTLRIQDNDKFSLEPGRNTIELHLTRLDHMVTYDPVFLTTRDTLKGDRISWDGIGEIAEGRLVIDCYSFTLFNSANTLGNIKLTGKTQDLFVFNRYGSNVFADSLICRNANITNESAGDVFVNASDRITAYIWGSGNTYYHGDPVTDLREVKGTGLLIRIK